MKKVIQVINLIKKLKIYYYITINYYNMDYQLEIININQIPFNVFVCNNSNGKEFKYIHKYTFNNGLNFIIGDYELINSPSTLVEKMQFDMDTMKYADSAYELQLYYQDYLGIYYDYKHCYKMFDYYTKNQELIQEVIDYYYEDDNSIDEEVY